MRLLATLMATMTVLTSGLFANALVAADHDPAPARVARDVLRAAPDRQVGQVAPYFSRGRAGALRGPGRLPRLPPRLRPALADDGHAVREGARQDHRRLHARLDGLQADRPGSGTPRRSRSTAPHLFDPSGESDRSSNGWSCRQRTWTAGRTSPTTRSALWLNQLRLPRRGRRRVLAGLEHDVEVAAVDGSPSTSGRRRATPPGAPRPPGGSPAPAHRPGRLDERGPRGVQPARYSSRGTNSARVSGIRDHGATSTTARPTPTPCRSHLAQAFAEPARARPPPVGRARAAPPAIRRAPPPRAGARGQARELEQLRPERRPQPRPLGGRLAEGDRPPPRAAADEPRRERRLPQRPSRPLRPREQPVEERAERSPERQLVRDRLRELERLASSPRAGGRTRPLSPPCASPHAFVPPARAAPRPLRGAARRAPRAGGPRAPRARRSAAAGAAGARVAAARGTAPPFRPRPRWPARDARRSPPPVLRTGAAQRPRVGPRQFRRRRAPARAPPPALRRAARRPSSRRRRAPARRARRRSPSPRAVAAPLPTRARPRRDPARRARAAGRSRAPRRAASPAAPPPRSAAAVTGPISGSVPGSGASAAGSSASRGRSFSAARNSKPGMRRQAITGTYVLYPNRCSCQTRKVQHKRIRAGARRRYLSRSVSSRKAVTRRSYSTGCCVDAARVLGVRHLPHPLRPAGGGEVLGLPHGLAAHAGIGVDEEDGPRGDVADAVDDRRRRAVVREARCWRPSSPLRSAARSMFSPAFERRRDRRSGKPAPSETTALKHGRLRGGHAAGSRRRPRSRSRRCGPGRRPGGSGGTRRRRSGRGRRPSERGRPGFRPVRGGSSSSTP